MLLATKGQCETGRLRRRMYPIQFYSGRNGSGKSLTAVYDTMPTLEAGRHVLSTVRLLDYSDPRQCATAVGCDLPDAHGDYPYPHMVAHPLYVPFTSWQQLLDFEKGDVVMDEVTGVADSNEAHSMPSAVRNILPQLRRRDIALRLTGLNWIRADKRIRESVNAVTVCRSSFPVSRKDEDGNARLWRPRRLTKAITYDAQSLPVDDHTRAAYEKADVLCKSRIWIPDCPATLAYDTMFPVLSVGTVTDTGRCAYCDGTRSAPQCMCPDYLADRAARKAASAEVAQRPSTAGRRRHAHEAAGHGNEDAA
jgi:hypothetical protein